MSKFLNFRAQLVGFQVKNGHFCLGYSVLIIPSTVKEYNYIVTSVNAFKGGRLNTSLGCTPISTFDRFDSVPIINSHVV